MITNILLLLFLALASPNLMTAQNNNQTNFKKKLKPRLLGALEKYRIKRAQAPKITNFKGIKHCQEIRLIASGSFGQVYLVKIVNLQSKQESALKVFQGCAANIECRTERLTLQQISLFEKKSETRLQISHIREDVSTGEKGVKASNLLLLEYIPGMDMCRTRFGGLQSAQLLFAKVVSMMEQIGTVLRKIHSINIYHNDVKPGNIIYEAHKRAFHLIDFGLSVPLALINESAYNGVFFWTTLPYMSPFHLAIMKQSISEESYVLRNTEGIRAKAVLADYYSLALTAINIIGHNCAGMNDALCQMSKRIVSMQKYAPKYEQQFTSWNIPSIANLLMPFWRTVQQEIEGYLHTYPNQNHELISLLADSLLLDRDYFC